MQIFSLNYSKKYYHIDNRVSNKQVIQNETNINDLDSFLMNEMNETVEQEEVHTNLERVHF